MNDSSQLPWSNVSRDGRSYALTFSSLNLNSSLNVQRIVIGSLNGGNVTPIATCGGLSTVSLAGWTTM